MKTQDLIGAELDRLVAKIDTPNSDQLMVEIIDGECGVYNPYWSGVWKGKRAWDKYSPSTQWHIGGPLIEKYEISLIYTTKGWLTYFKQAVGHWSERGSEATGSTPLIAAMRAIVSSVYGESVDA